MPQGFIDGLNAPTFITVEDMRYAKSLDVDGVFISLQKVVYFNKNGMSFFLDILNQIKGDSGKMVGFFGYTPKTYSAILRVYENKINFCMYDTFTTLSMFCGIPEVNRDTKTLLYNQNKTQRSSIIFELRNRGFKVDYTDDSEMFLKARKQFVNDGMGDYGHFIAMTYLGNIEGKIASHIQGNLVIYTLRGYVDAGINDVFDILYHQKSLSVGFKLFIFDGTEVASMNIHGVNFFSKLSVAAAEYGATIVIAGLAQGVLQEKLRIELEDAGVLFFDSLEELLRNKKVLDEFSGGAAINKKSKAVLTKQLIATLPVFVNSAIYAITTMTNIQPIKESAKVVELKIDTKNNSFMAASIGFYGDVDGVLILVFSKKIATQACKILIGREDADENEVGDSLSEFVNIIAGRAKVVLSGTNTQVNITLPRSFMNLEELRSTIEGKKGAEVIMSFDKEPFYILLTT